LKLLQRESYDQLPNDIRKESEKVIRAERALDMRLNFVRDLDSVFAAITQNPECEGIVGCEYSRWLVEPLHQGRHRPITILDGMALRVDEKLGISRQTCFRMCLQIARLLLGVAKNDRAIDQRDFTVSSRDQMAGCFVGAALLVHRDRVDARSGIPNQKHERSVG
jgi:hypothetical protein